jgi:2-hydroxy-6-oxonona-2,4-dienedioate hydrolase
MRKFFQFATGALTGATTILALKSYQLFKQDLAAAHQRIQKESKIIETAAGPINYGSAGEGPPVLVIHGAGGGFDQALHTSKFFGEGFKWIAPSRFGYLGSYLPENASPATQADAYAALLDRLGIERVPVIGLSAGGPSTIQFALRYPDRCLGLVLISAISYAMIEVAANPEVMEILVDKFVASDWIIWLGVQLTRRKLVPPLGVPMRVIKNIGEADTSWLQTLLTYVLPVQPRRAGLVNDFAQIYKLDIFPRDHINTPTLVIHARDDSLVSIKQGRYTAKYIPTARLVELPSGGHLMIGQQARVRAEVESFLNGLV